MLFDDIDEPGLATIDVYERRGGYETLRKALADAARGRCTSSIGSGLRGRGGAGFSMGKKASFIPQGDDGQVPRLQRRRVRAGHLQGPRAHAEEPAHADRGHDHRRVRRRAPTARSSTSAASTSSRPTSSRRAVAEARDAGFLGERHPRLGPLADRCGVHRGAGAYICGEETALLDSLEGKRGNPRLKPPFPANQGLYQGPTLINNVETLATVPHIMRDGRRGVRQDRRRELDRHEARLRVGQRPAARQLRDRARHAVARDHLRPGRRPAGGPRGQALVPRRLVARRC